MHLIERGAKWQRLPVLLKLTMDAEVNISTRAIRAVDTWIDRFNSSGAQPTDAELKAAREAVNSPSLGEARVRRLKFYLGS